MLLLYASGHDEVWTSGKMHSLWSIIKDLSIFGYIPLSLISDKSLCFAEVAVLNVLHQAIIPKAWLL